MEKGRRGIKFAWYLSDVDSVVIDHSETIRLRNGIEAARVP